MVLFWVMGVLVGMGSGGGVADTPFVQEYHTSYPVGKEPGANDVRALAVDGAGGVWAATRAGVYRLEEGRERWQGLMNPADAGPTYDVVVDRTGTVWVGAWNGMYRSTPSGLERLDGIESLQVNVVPFVVED